ncbi:hypothetical protein EDB86DRAFT_1133081 [Lactarius hatsudake]|nr:hypothetical protein EDB86DRAFT_1133081 [Lactarius hatsudake]
MAPPTLSVSNSLSRPDNPRSKSCRCPLLALYFISARQPLQSPRSLIGFCRPALIGPPPRSRRHFSRYAGTLAPLLLSPISAPPRPFAYPRPPHSVTLPSPVPVYSHARPHGLKFIACRPSPLVFSFFLPLHSLCRSRADHDQSYFYLCLFGGNYRRVTALILLPSPRPRCASSCFASLCCLRARRNLFHKRTKAALRAEMNVLTPRPHAEKRKRKKKE